MRFSDYATERAHLDALSDTLEGAGERRYLIRRIIDDTTHVDEMFVRVSIHADIDRKPNISIVVERTGYGFVQHPFSELTLAELEIVTKIRSLVDQWTSGKIDRLPLAIEFEATLKLS